MSRTPTDVLLRGFRVVGVGIREQWRIFAVAVTGSAVYGAMTVASAFVLGRVAGEVIVPAFQQGRTTAGALAAAAAAILGVAVLKVLGIIARRIGAGVVQYRLQAAYRRRVVRQYLRLPLSWHQRHPTGTLLSNANADVESTWYVMAPLPFACGTLLMLAITGVALVLTDPVLAVVGCVVFPVIFAVNFAYSRRMAPRMTRAQQLRADVSEVAHESFDGALVVKTLGREDEETARFRRRSEELRDAMVSVGKVRGLFDPMMEAVPTLGTLAALLVGTARLRSGATTVEDLVSVAYLFTVLAMPIRAIGWVLADLPRVVVGWDRVQRVLTAGGGQAYGDRRLDPAGRSAELAVAGVSFGYDVATDDVDLVPDAAAVRAGTVRSRPGSRSPGPDAVPDAAGTGGAAPNGSAPGGAAGSGSGGAVGSGSGGVVGSGSGGPAGSGSGGAAGSRSAGPAGSDLGGVVGSGSGGAAVSGRRGGAAADGSDRVRVLHDVTFDVAPGRTVALVGPTGSGKSTLVTLLVRLVDPDTGAVLVDGADLRALPHGGVSEHAALVSQATFLFDDTVRGNVTLGADLPDDEVWAALRLAQADRFVRALPDGLDTRVGERGTTLSGGQRQRLALARALVRRPRLLVLDDATSSVDPTVEAAILRGLRSADLGSTVVVVAYRRATIALADEVVYVEHGRVVARGSHAELVASTPGYALLVNAYDGEAARRRSRVATSVGAGAAAADGSDSEGAA